MNKNVKKKVGNVPQINGRLCTKKMLVNENGND